MYTIFPETSDFYFSRLENKRGIKEKMSNSNKGNRDTFVLFFFSSLISVFEIDSFLCFRAFSNTLYSSQIIFLFSYFFE